MVSIMKTLQTLQVVSFILTVSFFNSSQVKEDNEVHRRAVFKKLHADLSENPSSLKLEVRFYVKFNKPKDHLHSSNKKSKPAHGSSEENDPTRTAAKVILM